MATGRGEEFEFKLTQLQNRINWIADKTNNASKEWSEGADGRAKRATIDTSAW